MSQNDDTSRSKTEESQNAHGHHIKQSQYKRGDFPGNTDAISHTDVCTHKQTQLMAHRLEDQAHRHCSPHTLVLTVMAFVLGDLFSLSQRHNRWKLIILNNLPWTVSVVLMLLDPATLAAMHVY